MALLRLVPGTPYAQAPDECIPAANWARCVPPHLTSSVSAPNWQFRNHDCVDVGNRLDALSFGDLALPGEEVPGTIYARRDAAQCRNSSGTPTNRFFPLLPGPPRNIHSKLQTTFISSGTRQVQ